MQWEQLHLTGAAAILPEEFVMGGSTVCSRTTYMLVKWATGVDHCTCWVVLSMDRQTHHLTHQNMNRLCFLKIMYDYEIIYKRCIFLNSRSITIQEKKDEEKNCFNVSIIIFLLPTSIIKPYTNVKYHLVPQFNSSVILQQLQNSCKSLLFYRGRGGREDRIKQTREKVRGKKNEKNKHQSSIFNILPKATRSTAAHCAVSQAIGPHTAMHSSIPNITLPHYSMLPVCSRAKLNSAKKNLLHLQVL